MIETIKEYIKQNFDIKNKPNTTYRNYMFVVFFLTFAAIAINDNDQVTIFYSFIGISLLCVIFYLIFHDDKPKKKEKQNITYEYQSSNSSINLGDYISETGGCIIAVLTLIITTYLIVSLYQYVGLGMFILIMLIGGGIIIPLIYAISAIISILALPILLVIIVIFIYFLIH